jgi:DHA1 family tetracycline resistance protein-like MFS transporter
MKSNNALIVILGTVTLDAVGIGLVMPVLPGLLRDIVHSDSIASHYGVLLALYALMQFLCAPVLRSTVRPLWPPPSPARFATWSHYRLRDHGDHTRPVDIRI